MRIRIALFFILALLAAGLPVAAKETEEKLPVDPACQKLIASFIAAMQLDDPDARTRALIPLVHPVMLSEDGKDIARNLKSSLHSRLASAAKRFDSPPPITEVKRLTRSDSSCFYFDYGGGSKFKPTVLDRYWIAKHANGGGTVSIVWLEKDGGPRVVEMNF